LINFPLLAMHAPLVRFDPLTFKMEAITFTIKTLRLLWSYVTLHSIYQILHFQHYKNINYENSYVIEILSKWNDLSLFFLFNSIISIIKFISFWKCKIIWTFKRKISLFNDISMITFLKKQMFNKWMKFLLIY